MQRESRLGRALWLVLLALVGGYVLADFVRSPLSTTLGAGAVRPSEVTIWVPPGESEDESGPVLEAAAAWLDAKGHPADIRRTRGAVSAGLISSLSSGGAVRGRVLAITSTTVADLAHDVHETLVPGVAEEATLARSLLRHSRPIGILAKGRLVLAVRDGSAIQTGSELVSSMTAAPAAQLFGIDDDVYSRDQLAALVNASGVGGAIHFSSFQSASAAARAVEYGDAHTILAARSALWPAIHAGELRPLDWPLADPQPQTWIALIAPPGTSSAEAEKLRAWIDRLQADRHWRRGLRLEGRHPVDADPRALARLLRHTASAEKLERLAARVENG